MVATDVYLIERDKELLTQLRRTLQASSEINLIGDSQKWLPRVQVARPSQVLLIGIDGDTVADLALLVEIRNHSTAVKVIFLSEKMDQPAILNRLILRGLNGYMTKSAGVSEIEFAVEKVKHDGIYVCTAFILKVLEKFPIGADHGGGVPYNLSRGEFEVLALVAEGHTNKYIANTLCVSVRTVESRRKKLLEKTGTVNTATLIRDCVKAGLIS